MQITAKTWKKYINQMSKISQTAADRMQEWISKYGFDDNKALLDYAYALSTHYGEAIGALTCQMYEATAVAQGVTVKAAEAAATPAYGEVAKAVNGAKKQSEKLVPSTVGRLVKQTGADTTLKNAERDGVQFAWVPQGDTCAFCLTLASRGWQYMSKKALKNGHAEHIHANCDCQYAIRFDSSSTVEGYDPDKYRELYDSAEGNTPEQKINSMRRTIAAHKKAVANSGGTGTIKLSAGSSSQKGETTKIELSEVDTNKIDDAIKYFSDEIRDLETENAIVIDKNGKVIQFVSTSTKNVDIFDVDLDGAYVTHNHPASNGMVSVGEDDFYFLQEHQNVASFRCCNQKYDYTVSVCKDISQVSYSELYRKALIEYVEGDDLQHAVFEELKARSYVNYDRISKKPD